jgi:hypothetical protein
MATQEAGARIISITPSATPDEGTSHNARAEALRDLAPTLYEHLGMCMSLIRRHVEGTIPVLHTEWLLALSQWEKVSEKVPR